jgi:hypothetical protein
MLSCRETTRLASEALDRKLFWGEWMQMVMHFLMCTPCKRARRRMRFVRQAAERLRQREEEDGAPALSSEARARIHQVLRDAHS